MHLTISTTDGARTSRHVEYDFNEEDDVQAPGRLRQERVR